jgi:lipopolysaccharide biosynthesis protein
MTDSLCVMAGLDPAIHVFAATARKDVDARHKAGHDESRTYEASIAPRGDSRVQAAQLRTVLHGHFFYPELASELMAKLQCNRSGCDLIFTTDSEAKAKLLRKTAKGYSGGEVQIRVVPNRGRDIGAFLTGVATSFTDRYDVIGHVHGKRSLAVEAALGENWREFLWQNLIGDKHPMMDVILDRFAADATLGIVFPQDPHLSDWDKNLDIAQSLVARMGIEEPLPPFFDFPVGTMFWARMEALRPVFELKFDWDEFPQEPLPIDGTMLHALERLLPFGACHAGYRFATTHIPGLTW